jgi:hypothetical protein
LRHIRHRPRISVNKLGEYLVATAARRRQIILDQKYPPDLQVLRYGAAQRAVVDHLIHGQDDSGILARHLHRLAEWEPGPDDSDYDVQRNRNCREAIESFMSMLAELPALEGFAVTAGSPDSQRLSSAGVSISVRPELIVQGVNRNGDPVIGAIKIHVSKSFPHDERSGDYVGTMLHQFGEQYLSEQGLTVHRHFYVIDVFGQRVFTAPRAFARRRADVDAACEEIASRWATL